MNLLLVSSSFVDGKGYIEHCADAVKDLLQQLPEGEVLFVPYAAAEHNWDAYSASSRAFFETLGETHRALHTCENPAEYISKTKLKMIFVGGGNTFLLTKTLQEKQLMKPIRQAVQDGTGYMGTSAGSNVTCPTLQTTNDMPIVQPESFETLGLVDFQINPHFVSGSLVAGHKGETREQRIAEYHQHNDRTVVGLPEQSWIVVDDSGTRLGGSADAVIFKRGEASRVWNSGTELAQ